MFMSRRWSILFLLPASTAHGWTAPQLRAPTRAYLQLRLRPPLLLGAEAPGSPECDTGEEVEKTEGIPNYMIRTSGMIARVADGSSSLAAVQDDGVLYEVDRLVSIVTTDLIDMVQMQGGSAQGLDSLGENILVDGLTFDDLRTGDVFDVAPPDSECGADVVTVEIVEARPASALELGELGDDEGKRQSLRGILSMANGMSGWTVRIAAPGRVRAGFAISKRISA